MYEIFKERIEYFFCSEIQFAAIGAKGSFIISDSQGFTTYKSVHSNVAKKIKEIWKKDGDITGKKERIE